MMPPLVSLPRQERFVYLDVLRAIAVFSVVLAHRFGSIHDVFDLGRYGVILFFFISGYCIAESILKYKINAVRNFVIARFLRIFPAYWASIALYILTSKESFSATTLLANLALMQRPAGEPYMQGLYWTLEVELLFYVSIAVLFMVGLLGSMRSLVCFFLVLVTYCLFAPFLRHVLHIPFPHGYPLFLASMYAGAILRRMDGAGLPKTGVFAAIGGYFVLVYLIVMYAIYNLWEPTNPRAIYQFMPFFVAAVTFLVFSYILPLHSRVLSYCGKVSYSIYLLHLIIRDVFFGFVDNFSFPLSVSFIAPIIMNALYLCLVVAVATVSYYTVESPAIAFGRRLTVKSIRLPTRAPAT